MLLLLAVASGSALPAVGQQKQGAWWIFGQQAGLNFNYQPPRAFVSSFPISNIGVATISSPAGELLFSGGSNRYLQDRNGQYMPHPWSTIRPDNDLSTLIVPDPVSATRYYVFGLGFSLPTAGNLSWDCTQVDMTLRNGLGAYTALDTTLMRYREQEFNTRQAAVLHSNGHDVWVMQPNSAGDTVRSVLVTAGSLSAVLARASPVALPQPPSITFMRSSPNSELLACPTDSAVWVLQINRATADLTPLVRLPTPGGRTVRTVAFSPDSRYLYVGLELDIANSSAPALLQYDLQAGSAAAIAASQAVVPTPGQTGLFDAQLGLDGKLYISLRQALALGVMDCPNNPAATCHLRLNALPLAPGTDGGFFPVLNQTFFRNANILQALAGQPTICRGDSVTLSAFGAGTDRFTWLVTGAPVPDTLGTVRVAPTQTVRYRVRAQGPCSADTASVVVRVVAPLQPFDLGPDLTLNTGQTVLFDAANPTARHLWSTGDTTRTLRVDTAGTYWVRVSNAGCTQSDTVRVGLVTGGLRDEASPDHLRVFPVPGDAEIRVEVVGAATQGTALLRDALGRTVSQTRLAESGGRIVTHALPAGLYLLEVRATPTSAPLRRRLLIQHSGLR